MKMKGKVEKMGENKQMEEKNPPVVRLGRELKYQGTILKIYEDQVISNGHACRWDFIHRRCCGDSCD